MTSRELLAAEEEVLASESVAVAVSAAAGDSLALPAAAAASDPGALSAVVALLLLDIACGFGVLLSPGRDDDVVVRSSAKDGIRDDDVCSTTHVLFMQTRLCTCRDVSNYRSKRGLLCEHHTRELLFAIIGVGGGGVVVMGGGVGVFSQCVKRCPPSSSCSILRRARATPKQSVLRNKQSPTKTMCGWMADDGAMLLWHSLRAENEQPFPETWEKLRTQRRETTERMANKKKLFPIHTKTKEREDRRRRCVCFLCCCNPMLHILCLLYEWHCCCCFQGDIGICGIYIPGKLGRRCCCVGQLVLYVVD